MNSIVYTYSPFIAHVGLIPFWITTGTMLLIILIVILLVRKEINKGE